MEKAIIDQLINSQDLERFVAYFKNEEVPLELIVYTVNSLTLELDGENDHLVSKMLGQLLSIKQFEPPNEIDGSSLLIRCINENAIQSLNVLLMNGFKVNIRDNEGRTPLTQAVIVKDIEILRTLLDYSENGDIDIIGSYYATSPLGIAFQNRDIDCIELLLSRKADPLKMDIDNGSKPLTDLIPENLKSEITALIKKYS